MTSFQDCARLYWNFYLIYWPCTFARSAFRNLWLSLGKIWELFSGCSRRRERFLEAQRIGFCKRGRHFVLIETLVGHDTRRGPHSSWLQSSSSPFSSFGLCQFHLSKVLIDFSSSSSSSKLLCHNSPVFFVFAFQSSTKRTDSLLKCVKNMIICCRMCSRRHFSASFCGPRSRAPSMTSRGQKLWIHVARFFDSLSITFDCRMSRTKWDKEANSSCSPFCSPFRRLEIFYVAWSAAFLRHKKFLSKSSSQITILSESPTNCFLLAPAKEPDKRQKMIRICKTFLADRCGSLINNWVGRTGGNVRGPIGAAKERKFEKFPFASRLAMCVPIN